MEIRIPLRPQPEKDADGMWHWKDCQWMDGGIGFPESGIADYCMFHRDDLLVVDEAARRVMFVTVAQDKKGLWNWGVFIKNPPIQKPATRVLRTNDELKILANQISEKIIIRTYVNGNSRDDQREATENERTVLFAIVFGVLMALNNGIDARRAGFIDPIWKAALDTAEYTAQKLIPGINTYDSIYCPVWDVVKNWPLEGKEE